MRERLIYRCKYCGKEFEYENNWAVHEEHECLLNPHFARKDESPFPFLKFLASATLTVAAMALIVISPMMFYPMLLGHEGPYSYIALTIFWAMIISPAIFASIIDYLRKRRET
jgi:hypothetical protein